MKFTVVFATVTAFLPFVSATLEATPLNIGKRAVATVYSKCKKDNMVALTFDDGPYIYNQDIVNTLNQHGIKGTFFVNGNNYRCIYDQPQADSVKNAFNSGHMFANHGWAHLDLATLSWDKVHDEMWRVEQALMKIVGVSPAFMRPPFGSYNDLVRDAAGVRNQSIVIWDLDAGDASGVSLSESKQRYQTAVNQHPNNILTLNHETIETTAHKLLPYAIQKLQAAGYQFGTVAECLGKKPYTSIKTAGTRDSSWKC